MQKAYKLNKDFVLTCVKDERKKIKAIPIRIKRKLRIFVEFSFVYQFNKKFEQESPDFSQERNALFLFFVSAT